MSVEHAARIPHLRASRDCDSLPLVLAPELDANGWTRVCGVDSTSDLLELAKSLGEILPTGHGQLVAQIRPNDRDNAHLGTLTATYGRGRFPLHTDTAFWPLPVRIVVLRVAGDNRRTTGLLSFCELLEDVGANGAELAKKSIWRITRGATAFYCSMRFQAAGVCGWRYDANCMSPVNGAARDLDNVIRPRTTDKAGQQFTWSAGEALIIANWNTLHSRGEAPADEGERVLERIYVR
jgi:hypothetical protein